jgi:hypothetical protein
MSTLQSPAVVKMLYQAIVPARVRGPLYSLRQLVKLLYQAIVPAAVRAPLYSLRQHIFTHSGSTSSVQPDSDADYGLVAQAPSDILPDESQVPLPERYPLNVEGIPTAPACLTPAVDSRPHQGLPERMMVGNPPREQLYL